MSPSIHPSIDPRSQCNGRVLFFAAVGPTYRDLTKRNVLHLAASGSGSIDFFLAHYAGNSSWWRSQAWHDAFVKYSVFYKAQKVDYVHRELVNRQTYDLSFYCFYWIADENIKFLDLNVINYLKLAQDSGAHITQAAVNFGEGLASHDSVNAFQTDVKLELQASGRQVDGRCLYRYTDFVEVMSPVFSTFDALRIAYGIHNTSLHSDWGLDIVWCRYVAFRLGTSPETSCAIIDAETMAKLPHQRSYEQSDAEEANAAVLRKYNAFRTETLNLSMPGAVQQCRVKGSQELAYLHFESGLQTRYILPYLKCSMRYGPRICLFPGMWHMWPFLLAGFLTPTVPCTCYLLWLRAPEPKQP